MLKPFLTNVVPHGCGLACIVNHVVPVLTTSSTFLGAKSKAADFSCFATRTNHIDLHILKQDIVLQLTIMTTKISPQWRSSVSNLIVD